MKPVRIEIDLSAACDPDARVWLDRILHKIEDGWHVWDTTSERNYNALSQTAWTHENRVRELLVASVRRGAWTLAPHGRSVRVTAHPSATNELSPKEAARLSEEPLCILVENRYSDGAFVERVATELDKALHGLWRRPGEPIRFDSLGGTGQMSNEIDRRTRQKRVQPRLVAIIDSDRKTPGGQASTAAIALSRICEDRNVSCWVLAKREAENYLPRSLLSGQPDRGADHNRLVDAWDRLNDEQKNFFDMKNGLPEELSEIEQELFGALSPVDREILSDGFGPSVYKCWLVWTIQAKNELLNRGQGDLKRGMNLIRKEV